MRRSKLLILVGGALSVAMLASVLVAGTAFAYGPWSGPGGMMGGYTGPAGGPGPGYYGGMPCGGWGWNSGTTPTGQPISLDQAVTDVQNYVKAGGNPDLVVTEVLEFQYNFYAMVKEQSTGIYAYELLVDKYSGAVYPEMGPNMMWNTKYGHMAGWGGGMMGGWWYGRNQTQTPNTPMTVTADHAKQISQQYLDANFPGTAAEDINTFYGYYTIHFTKDGKVAGMLSVNGYTGAVWYHSWHGDFIQETSVS
ncbi:MAG: hypothetical protein M1319_00015 [Chloroflexi bacterium]|nr:hypothetical protein [Chloroflexota bacterium]